MLRCWQNENTWSASLLTYVRLYVVVFSKSVRVADEKRLWISFLHITWDKWFEMINEWENGSWAFNFLLVKQAKRNRINESNTKGYTICYFASDLHGREQRMPVNTPHSHKGTGRSYIERIISRDCDGMVRFTMLRYCRTPSYQNGSIKVCGFSMGCDLPFWGKHNTSFCSVYVWCCNECSNDEQCSVWVKCCAFCLF